MSENKQLHEFLNEVTHWVMGLIDQHKAIPKVLVGFKSNNDKFALILSGTPINADDRDGFIKTVLTDEDCVMYGYSTSIGTLDENNEPLSEQLIVSAATPSEFLYGIWSIERNESNQVQLLGKAEVFSGDTPEDQSYTRALTLSEVNEEDREKHRELWRRLQDRVRWMQSKKL